MDDFFKQLGPSLWFTLATLVSLIWMLIHWVFAVGVYRDAVALWRRGKAPLLVGTVTWFLATLMGGVFVAGLYWVIHHSTLRRD